ncbi:MAG: prepilin-type N-terminal cleavage/methylation domain-containing protein [Patescibacteria group bacterium]
MHATSEQPHRSYRQALAGGVISHWSFSSGFTIMEMIVTIGIFAMMTLLYTANFKGFQFGLAVESNADQLVSSLRQAQLWALTGELVGGSRPDGGYGVTLTSPCTSGVCTFTVFGDTCSPTLHQYDNGCDTVIRTEKLNSQVSVTSVTPSSPLTVISTFPTSESYVNATKGQSATITLTHRAQTEKVKTISFDGVSGQITIQ